ncbi:KpsF/GutQ family sugar-phosphate isomerase [Candidatus Nitrosacidococcus sp. I8]|uniref:KpsF/GutQ family sugar-phosphate isomerase n=1 Tax=Candidatus Nitrosacidococcus sp. I8 TaxID=2942908 RepID=UPI002227707F|nr:KpsF/GutQ family sugar-phosphate isomerase [Candidatus Nitrosacidococcus sp. I8]CAH9019585.1 Arabinose 5-phosphate isomerase KdsD [Candidatus Nitrosacidococcus sp. I8]
MDTKIIQLGIAVLETEAKAIADLKTRIDSNFIAACKYMLSCTGRVIVLGMGKSGHIGSKIAATLASTGTPAFFVHPGEASHGDLGMITDKDVVLALSNSGETEEICMLIPLIKRLDIPLIALTSRSQSTLGKMADVHINISVAQEACPLGLAPTASTTATLAMGDALAIALLESRGFTKEDFARSHPGGQLGRRLLLHIRDIMHQGTDIPIVRDHDLLSQALLEMTSKGLGMTTVINNAGELVGIFTDGDLRRSLDQGVDIHHTLIAQVMTVNYKSLGPDQLAVEALSIMERYRVNALPVVEYSTQKLVGALNMHDLLRAGVL